MVNSDKSLLGRTFGFVTDVVPTIAILSLAGAIGWWGHRHEWKVPSFSELKGHVKEADDWCSEHNVPESACIECDEKLLPKGKARGWCGTHGIPECVLCNPDLAQLPKLPTNLANETSLAKRMLDFSERATNTPNCRTHLRRIQFVSAAAVDKSGIAVDPVWNSPALEFISAPGELGYDQSRIAHLSSRSSGTVWKVFKHLGQDVKAGDILALVDAAEVGKAKTELLQAFAGLQLKSQTVASIKESGGAVAPARVREAEAAVSEAEIRLTAACQTLTNLGLAIEESQVRAMSAEQLKTKLHFLGIPASVLETKPTTTNLLPLVAPMDGRILSREVVAGEVVDTIRILFEVVDTRHLWLTLDVKGEDAARVRVGQTVRFKPDHTREELVGTLAWRSTQADLKTRTVKVRADLHDAAEKLVANTFGVGKIVLREEPNAVSVPNEAVQWDGCCNVVFVRDRDYLKSEYKLFHVRKVRIGAKDDKTTEVVGVLPGELVATKGSGLLLTELLRGSLGEGCACHSKK